MQNFHLVQETSSLYLRKDLKREIVKFPLIFIEIEHAVRGIFQILVPPKPLWLASDNPGERTRIIPRPTDVEIFRDRDRFPGQRRPNFRISPVTFLSIFYSISRYSTPPHLFYPWSRGRKKCRWKNIFPMIRDFFFLERRRIKVWYLKKKKIERIIWKYFNFYQ